MTTIQFYSHDDLHMYFWGGKSADVQQVVCGWVVSCVCLGQFCSEAGMLQNWKEKSKQTSLLHQKACPQSFDPLRVGFLCL